MKRQHRNRMVLWTTLMPFAVLLPAFPAVGQSPAGQSTEQAAREAEQARRQRDAADERVRRIVMNFAARARETKALVESLAAAEKGFSERLNSLNTNDDGKRLAQDAAAFFEIVQLGKEPIVSAEQIRGRQSAINSLVDGLEQELKRDAAGFVPGDQTVREVDENFFWARERLALLNAKKAWIDLTIAQAPKDLDLARTPTLQDQIRDYLAARQQLFARARASGTTQGRLEGEPQIREAAREAELKLALAEKERILNDLRAEIERMKLDFELKSKLQQAEQARLEADADRKLKDAQAEVERQTRLADAKRSAEDSEAERGAKGIEDETKKKELFAKCDDPTVKETLAPFISEGYWQPAGSGIVGRKGTAKGGMSLKAISGYGALGPGDGGVAKLWRIACSPNNDRPRWSGTSQNESDGRTLKRLSGETIEKVKRARDLLKELGATLVERGLLQE